MAKAQVGKIYAQIVNGRCHKVFTITDLPEWNSSQLEVVEVIGISPTEGDIWNGTIFFPYIPTPLTKAENDAAADKMAMKHATEALPTIIAILTKLSNGSDKAALKIFDDMVKTEQAKKL